MVMRWEDGAPSPVIRWEDMQPDKIYWEDTEIWTPPSSGPDGALTRTFRVTIADSANFPGNLRGWSRQTLDGDFGEVSPVPTNIIGIFVVSAGRGVVLSSSYRNAHPGATGYRFLNTQTLRMQWGDEAAVDMEWRNNERFRTAAGYISPLPSIGSTIDVVLTASDAAIIAIA